MPSPRRSSKPDMDTEWASAAEIAAAVKEGRVSALSVTEAALARIMERDPVLNAFTDVVADRARKRAAEMLFTGEFIDAPTALDWGLVNRVAQAKQLLETAHELANNLKAKPRATLALGKALFYRQLQSQLAAAYADASRTIAGNMDSDVAREGVDAFLDKRGPRWKP